ncbi:MAG: hypothetical protein H7326_06710 [Bdellovibrionaceae bacterium]|nr:hypothetical protein [Pseudobdellovibrionaceae bacterium]
MLKSKSSRKNQKGMAVMELIPIMIIIVILINYSLGFFGAIHTGILNSMAARNYAFETFRNRSNLVYLRDHIDSVGTNYAKYDKRWHASISDKKGGGGKEDFVATERRIDFLGKNEEAGSKDVHNKQIGTVIDGKRFTANEGVNPIWVRPQYGICLNAKCGKK